MDRSTLARVGGTLGAALLLGACASTPEAPKGEPYDAARIRVPDDDPIGLFLADVDASVRAWNHLALAATSVDEQRKAKLLAQDLTRRTTKRQEQLLAQLGTGPPYNRMVAAAALGFTDADEALGPLLAALEDPEPRVRANALLGLGLLARRETPLDGIAEHLGKEAQAGRTNAAFALRQILAAGAEADPTVLAAARAGLDDPEPSVRAQCALILAAVDDSDAVEELALLLHDATPISALAASRALAYLGSRDPHVKGTCARALASNLDSVDAGVRRGLLRSLMALSGRNYGNESKDWLEWAHRLP